MVHAVAVASGAAVAAGGAEFGWGAVASMFFAVVAAVAVEECAAHAAAVEAN